MAEGAAQSVSLLSGREQEGVCLYLGGQEDEWKRYKVTIRIRDELVSEDSRGGGGRWHPIRLWGLVYGIHKGFSFTMSNVDGGCSRKGNGGLLERFFFLNNSSIRSGNRDLFSVVKREAWLKSALAFLNSESFPALAGRSPLSSPQACSGQSSPCSGIAGWWLLARTLSEASRSPHHRQTGYRQSSFPQ